ncbi:iron complex transport system permease protein [Quadrisphaera granulorum]|uniref:Iron complex transport system permease protein n=1 Tax=Quadrisphaera granulorum TaxID=317664 RepID=A0A315ZQC4_9ACTN|nr:iron chelate uptake ABC transporter family permease subunit [Quadrisphaera granulorum]PWJ47726.1 iron complex transport system permease protein [Quadrisphaera granulorum]SZE98680.1 iron complex transport system permease protein [Quadrisphaera granulorum]
MSQLDVAAPAAQVARARTAARRRSIVVGAVLAVLVTALFLLSLSLGHTIVPPADVVAALLGTDTSRTAFTVVELRAPRAFTALGVGLCFGVSGAVLQALARNPLASPDVVGITAGASTGAVAVIVATSAGTGALTSSMVSTPLAALAGGGVSGLVVYRLARARGVVTPYRLVLVGIGVSAVLTSLTSWLVTRASIDDAQKAAVWLAGSLGARTWDDAVPAVGAACLVLPAAAVLARRLRVLQLGEQTALALGVDVRRTRRALVAVSVTGAAVATAAAGPIAFVAFVAAPLARRIVGSTLTVVPAALVGAALVLAADLVGRTAFGAVQLPVGIVTGVIGAPYLMWLLSRPQRIGQGE